MVSSICCSSVFDYDQKENTALDNEILLVTTGNEQLAGPKEGCRPRNTSRHISKENCLPPCMEHYKSLKRTDGYSAGEFCARNVSNVKKLRKLQAQM